MAERPKQLAHLEYLGDATKFAGQMHALIPKCVLLENFSAAEVQLLAHFMDVYRCEVASEIIREGDGGDFMLMVLEGTVEVHKRDRWNTQQLLASVDAGRTLGEMSMIDGAPRFATCIAAGATLIAVLHRESLARIRLGRATRPVLTGCPPRPGTARRAGRGAAGWWRAAAATA